MIAENSAIRSSKRDKITIAEVASLRVLGFASSELLICQGQMVKKVLSSWQGLQCIYAAVFSALLGPLAW
jgi:hypothetical protein